MTGGTRSRRIVRPAPAGTTLVVLVGFACAAAALAAGRDGPHALRALLAGSLGAVVAWVAVTLPGLTARGLAFGGFFVLAGMVSWTYLDSPGVVWAVLAVEGLTFAWWSWPWLPGLSALPRLGTAWLGLAYWLLGIAGAVLVGHTTVAAQRLAYAGVFTLAALAALASVRGATGPPADPTIGVAAAFLLATAALLVSGSANLFDRLHTVPDSHWGDNMQHRFWGGPALLYHPNSFALIAVAAAVRIGADRRFAGWQRLAVTVLAGAVVLWTNSRTGFVLATAVAVLHAILLWRGGQAGWEGRPARRWLAAGVPFAVLALVLALSGGQGFLLKSRYGGGDPTSGRVDTWRQVGVEWRDAGWPEKLFGDAKTSRAVVIRADDGSEPGAKPLNLTTDNAAVGALRRGGVLGVLAFLLGLTLLSWHAVRRWRTARGSPPAWFTILAIGALPTIATADWLLGGTGGTLWILLLAGEAFLLFGAGRAAGEPVIGAGTGDQPVIGAGTGDQPVSAPLPVSAPDTGDPAGSTAG